MSESEAFRSEVIESAFSEIEESPAEISEEITEFFPLDFEGRFPSEVWGDFFKSHDFVYTDRYSAPASNDVDVTCCIYKCKHCLCEVYEYLDDSQPLPEDNGDTFDPDDYCRDSQSFLSGAQDINKYRNERGHVMMDDVPGLTPQNIWMCPNYDPLRVRRIFDRPTIGDHLLDAPHCVMNGDEDGRFL